MNLVTKILISTLAVLLTAYILPGVKVDGFLTAVVVAAVLAFLNAVVKPLMILFTIPITILSLGLFLMVINALIILLAAKLVDGFVVRGFWWAILFSIILSITNSVFESILNEKNEK